jgi:hypothetical protein
LSKKGVSATVALVYKVKKDMKKSGRKKAAVARRNGHANGAAVTPVRLVVRVKDLANEVGGLKNLKQLVDVLAG